MKEKRISSKLLVFVLTIGVFGIINTALFIWGQSAWFVWGIVFAIGVLVGIQNNNMQFMMSDSAPDAPDFANGLFLASANLVTTVGTAFCGMFITWLGTRYSLYDTFAMLTVGFILVILHTRTRSTRKIALA